MTFSISGEGDAAIVAVNGELTVSNRQKFKEALMDRLSGGDRRFVVDFEETSYIDSSGLGVLVSMSKRVREKGGEMRLAGLNEDLHALFELTRLDTLFQIYDDREAALAF